MISQLTETMVNIEGEALRGVTWVTIDEVERYLAMGRMPDVPRETRRIDAT